MNPNQGTLMIAINIDVSKIDKNRLFKGKNGTYLDALLIETPNSKYGNSHMVVQSVSKEERKAGVEGNILGSAKYLGGGNSTQAQPSTSSYEGVRDEIPF